MRPHILTAPLPRHQPQRHKTKGPRLRPTQQLMRGVASTTRLQNYTMIHQALVQASGGGFSRGRTATSDRARSNLRLMFSGESKLYPNSQRLCTATSDARYSRRSSWSIFCQSASISPFWDCIYGKSHGHHLGQRPTSLMPYNLLQKFTKP